MTSQLKEKTLDELAVEQIESLSSRLVEYKESHNLKWSQLERRTGVNEYTLKKFSQSPLKCSAKTYLIIRILLDRDNEYPLIAYELFRQKILHFQLVEFHLHRNKFDAFCHNPVGTMRRFYENDCGETNILKVMKMSIATGVQL